MSGTEFDKKSLRILDLYERLQKGEALNKRELSNEYGISEKSVQRDIEEIRAYLSEKYSDEGNPSIIYDRAKNVYVLLKKEREYLTRMEIIAITKILLESRAFNKLELDAMLDKLILQASPNDRPVIKDMLLNERYHYVPLRHGMPLLETIWNVSCFISRQEMIAFSYTRQDKKEFNRTVKPVAITFSEFYFYLIGYIDGYDKDFPGVFRLDRCKEIKGLKQPFQIPYADRFSAGEFKKRIQFMYSGELMTIKFLFWGSSLEAVLDRLPTARVIGQDDGKHIIESEVFGNGIKMWLLSQIDFIEVLAPAKLRDEVSEIAKNLAGLYL